MRPLVQRTYATKGDSRPEGKWMMAVENAGARAGRLAADHPTFRIQNRRIGDARPRRIPESRTLAVRYGYSTHSRHQRQPVRVDQAFVGDLQARNHFERQEAHRHERVMERRTEGARCRDERFDLRFHRFDRFGAHQAAERERHLGQHPVPAGDHHAAVQGADSPRGRHHRHIVGADDDEVVMVVGHRGCQCPFAEPHAPDEALAHRSGRHVALDDGDLQQVAGGIGERVAVANRRFVHEGGGHQAIRAHADDPRPAPASRNPEVDAVPRDVHRAAEGPRPRPGRHNHAPVPRHERAVPEHKPRHEAPGGRRTPRGPPSGPG